MKKSLFIAVSALLLLNFLSCRTTGDTAHNSRNSLDWAGVYAGIIPGANADIKTEITLNNDGTYKLTQQYIDKSDEVFTNTGTFQWNAEGSIIILDIENTPPYYQVGENMLIQLDMKGKKIGGQFADNYILKMQE